MLRPRTETRAYLIQQRIAAGGMGEVYRAEDQRDGRSVAIKRMLEHAAGDEDLLRLFMREMMVASTLEHHNVVEVFDVGQAGHEMFLVMELVEGPTLAEVLDVLRTRGTPPPMQVACGIAMHVAQGLAHAHGRALPDGTPLGIVHRDVAPENVLIGPDGVAKLLDFGLATLDGQNLTQPGVIRGRPRSLAPEQARGDNTDARTDVFALGAILFEMTTGLRLYPDENVATLLWRVAAGDYEPVRQRMPNHDPALVDIIERAVAVSPDDRHRSARQFERELSAFQASRELRVSNGAIAALVASTFDDIMNARNTALEGSEGELEGRLLTLPAESVDLGEIPEEVEDDRPRPPAQVGEPAQRWKRPQLPPRPAGWDKITPTPDSPARHHHPAARARRFWNTYAVALGLATIATFGAVWWAGA